MMFPSGAPMILMIGWALIGQVKTEDFSENMVKFLTLFTGNWDNKVQIEEGFQDHDLIQAKMVLVNIPALSSEIVVYIEEADNTEMHFMYLAVATEDIYGNIYMTLYNFTDITKYSPGSFNISVLSTVTHDDLQQNDNCVAAFEFAGRGDVLVGTWPVCGISINGKHPVAFVTFTCDYLICEMPLGIEERPTRLPYTLIRQKPRFPIPDSPAGYVSPCQKKDC